MPNPSVDGGFTEQGSGAIPDASGLWPPYGLSCLRWRESLVAMAANTNKQVAGSSSNRVYLACFDPTGVLLLATNSANLAANQGIYSDQTTPFIRTWSASGPAVSQAWFGRTTAIVNIIVQEAFYEPPCG